MLEIFSCIASLASRGDASCDVRGDIRMIRSAITAGALFCCLTACSPQGESALNLPAVPPPSAMEATAARALRIDIVGDKKHVIDGKVPNFVRIEGVAPADWFFEGVFSVRFEAEGLLIETPALSLDDWTNGEPYHPYRATVSFDLPEEMKAELVLEEDMPKHDAAGNELPLRSVRIPVVLTPMKK
jgi:hypothetical protein